MYRQSEKKLVKQQCLLHMSPQYGELRSTSGRDRFRSLGHTSYFQRLPRLGSVTVWQSSSERQPNFAALTEGATCVWHGDHHVGHWSTFLVVHLFPASMVYSLCKRLKKLRFRGMPSKSNNSNVVSGDPDETC